MVKRYSIQAKADGGYLREDASGDIVKFSEANQLDFILDWAERTFKQHRIEGMKSEEARIAWAILNAPR